MKFFTALLLLSIVGCGGNRLPVEAKSESDGTMPASERIYARNFRTDNVIGLLGQPLGEVARVTGTAIDGNVTRAKADQGKILLKIETVNGNSVDVPFQFEFLRANKGIEAPSPGDDFDFYVHEYGEFEGIVEPPPELDIEFVRMANDGFHYRPFITIHKSNN